MRIEAAEGRPTLCEPGAAANGAGTLLGGARRLRRAGEALHHHLGVSAFAGHATVSRRSLVRIEPELPLDEAALFGCAVLTGVGAVINTARVPAGSSAAVIGLGGVGLCSLLGAIVTAGLPAPTATLPLPAVNLVDEERTLKGSYIGTAVPVRDLPRCIQLYRRGRLPVDRLMSARLSLEEINQGFDRLQQGEAIRQVVVL
jgi:Zn-dependent alcohol dehydrogenase